jgi:hypothetical protein
MLSVKPLIVILVLTGPTQLESAAELNETPQIAQAASTYATSSPSTAGATPAWRQALRWVDPRPIKSWAQRTLRKLSKRTESDDSPDDARPRETPAPLRAVIPRPLPVEDEKRVVLKLQSVQYLAGLDLDRYPEVLDTLLASLDDESETVRYETLSALHRHSGVREHDCRAASSVSVASSDRTACAECMRRQKIRLRLERFLLECDSQGRLKEPSERNRGLALSIMELWSPRFRGIDAVSHRAGVERTGVNASSSVRFTAPPPIAPSDAGGRGVRGASKASDIGREGTVRDSAGRSEASTDSRSIATRRHRIRLIPDGWSGRSAMETPQEPAPANAKKPVRPLKRDSRTEPTTNDESTGPRPPDFRPKWPTGERKSPGESPTSQTGP